MSSKIVLTYRLTGEDFAQVWAFMHRGERLNFLQKIVMRLGNWSMGRKISKRNEQPIIYEFSETDVKAIDADEVDVRPWEIFGEVSEYDEGYLFFLRTSPFWLLYLEGYFATVSNKRNLEN